MKKNVLFVLVITTKFICVFSQLLEGTQSLSKIDFNGTILYISPNDNATTAWSYNTEKITQGNGAISSSDGKSNTSSIVYQLEAEAYAAYACDTLSAYGYNDWYLPSKDELSAICASNYIIIEPLKGWYWSSTESSENIYSWKLGIPNGIKSTEGKTQWLNVRCIRKD